MVTARLVEPLVEIRVAELVRVDGRPHAKTFERHDSADVAHIDADIHGEDGRCRERECEGQTNTDRACGEPTIETQLRENSALQDRLSSLFLNAPTQTFGEPLARGLCKSVAWS